MTQFKIGFVFFVFLVLPPVSTFLESHMVLHMHMQMPLLVITGLLMAPFFQKCFAFLFAKWNQNGIAGILLFIIIITYWMIPKTMDDALSSMTVELFKFISLPFLGGVPLRDSWIKLQDYLKISVIALFTIAFLAMGLLYIQSPIQLCNNYLLVEQITLGWAYLFMSLGFIVYLIYKFYVNPSDYE